MENALAERPGLRALRVAEGPRVERRVDGLDQQRPAGVERGEQRQRGRDRRRPGVGQFGPGDLIVGADHRVVFGQREPVAAVGVEVAVGDVVDELADAPGARADRAIELLLGVAGDQGGEVE